MDGNPTFGQMSFEPPMNVATLIAKLLVCDPSAMVVHGNVAVGDGVLGVSEVEQGKKVVLR
jgi:hypothetical protein